MFSHHMRVRPISVWSNLCDVDRRIINLEAKGPSFLPLEYRRGRARECSSDCEWPHLDRGIMVIVHIGCADLYLGCPTILLKQQVATETAQQLRGKSPNFMKPNPSPLSVLSPCTSWRGHFFYGIKSIEPFALPVDPRTEKILPEVLDLELA